MRRALAAVVLALVAAGAAHGQTNVEAARQEVNEGARAYRAGKFDEAEQRFRRALALDPEGKNTRLFIARAIQQQYKPGDMTPENVAMGEKAIAAYAELLGDERNGEDAYKATIFLYNQLKRDDKVVEMLTQRAYDSSVTNEQRAEALIILSSKRWQCSYDVTEQKENKTARSRSDRTVIHYKMPADPSDFIRARQCAVEGLQLVEEAAALNPKSANAWSYKANLLREAAKLAEMEGDAVQQTEYQRQYDEALATQKRLAQEATNAKLAEEQAAPTNVIVGEPGERTNAPPVKRKTIVSGGVLNGKAISKPAPEYPPIAKAAGAQGVVTVQILVDEEGNVVSASAVSGHPLLQQAAVAAARQAKFSPTRLSGQPVKVSGVVTYNFMLQ